MPQTIAIQRGTVTLTSGNTPTTVYTQSGGLATRIIFNFVALQSAGTFSNPALNIVHVSSAGGAALIGNWRIQSGWGNGFVTANQGAFALGQQPTPGAFLQGGFGSGGTNFYTAEQNALNVQIQSPVNFERSSCLPQNSWIGPSDTIKIAWQDGGGNSVTAAWSFVTITETS